MTSRLAQGRPYAKTSWGYFGVGFIEPAATADAPEPPDPPGPSTGNRIGGTGAIRKPPRRTRPA